MHCKFHNRVEAMRADRLSLPPLFSRRQVVAIRASALPKFSIAPKRVKLSFVNWADAQNGITYPGDIVNGETQFRTHKVDSNVLASLLVTWPNGKGYSNSKLATLAPELLTYDGYGTGTHWGRLRISSCPSTATWNKSRPGSNRNRNWSRPTSAGG